MFKLVCSRYICLFCRKFRLVFVCCYYCISLIIMIDSRLINGFVLHVGHENSSEERACCSERRAGSNEETENVWRCGRLGWDRTRSRSSRFPRIRVDWRTPGSRSNILGTSCLSLPVFHLFIQFCPFTVTTLLVGRDVIVGEIGAVFQSVRQFYQN